MIFRTKFNWFAMQALFAVFILIFLNTTVHAKDGIEITGDILQILLPGTAMGMTYVYDDDLGRKQFYKSLALTVASTYALKYAVQKKRPLGNSNDSFISGHTSAAFSGASFIQRRYGWKFGMPAYIAAAFVGWSRVQSENHDLNDVMRGAAIGTISTYLFTTPYKNVSITPIAGKDIYGARLQVHW